MICPSCKLAGKILTRLHTGNTIGKLEEKTALINADALHKDCAGCDCQHRIDMDYINRTVN